MNGPFDDEDFIDNEGMWMGDKCNGEILVTSDALDKNINQSSFHSSGFASNATLNVPYSPMWLTSKNARKWAENIQRHPESWMSICSTWHDNLHVYFFNGALQVSSASQTTTTQPITNTRVKNTVLPIWPVSTHCMRCKWSSKLCIRSRLGRKLFA